VPQLSDRMQEFWEDAEGPTTLSLLPVL
jgi:hypothetical protein